MNRREKLEGLLALNDRDVWFRAAGYTAVDNQWNYMYSDGYTAGAIGESRRLAPLHKAMLDEIDILREALEIISKNGADRGMGWTPAQHARIALSASTAIDEILKETKGE